MRGNRRSLHVTELSLPGVQRVQRIVRTDARGAFSRLFCADELRDAGWSWPIVQVNHSLTRGRGNVRGLHYQKQPHAEAKLVSCVRGEVWDVAVDLRKGSPTFLRWHAERLNAAEGAALFIPPGCAHGFQVLTEEAELIYCHSAAYEPEAEAGVHVQDARLNISWPLSAQGLSERDAHFGPLRADFEGIQL